jgi:hypothetical protein
MIIQEIADNITSPLEEINERLRISNLDYEYKKAIELENEKVFEKEQRNAEWCNIKNFDIFKKNI